MKKGGRRIYWEPSVAGTEPGTVAQATLLTACSGQQAARWDSRARSLLPKPVSWTPRTSPGCLLRPFGLTLPPNTFRYTLNSSHSRWFSKPTRYFKVTGGYTSKGNKIRIRLFTQIVVVRTCRSTPCAFSSSCTLEIIPPQVMKSFLFPLWQHGIAL